MTQQGSVPGDLYSHTKQKNHLFVSTLFHKKKMIQEHID